MPQDASKLKLKQVVPSHQRKGVPLNRFFMPMSEEEQAQLEAGVSAQVKQTHGTGQPEEIVKNDRQRLHELRLTKTMGLLSESSATTESTSRASVSMDPPGPLIVGSLHAAMVAALLCSAAAEEGGTLTRRPDQLKSLVLAVHLVVLLLLVGLGLAEQRFRWLRLPPLLGTGLTLAVVLAELPLWSTYQPPVSASESWSRCCLHAAGLQSFLPFRTRATGTTWTTCCAILFAVLAAARLTSDPLGPAQVVGGLLFPLVLTFAASIAGGTCVLPTSHSLTTQGEVMLTDLLLGRHRLEVEENLSRSFQELLVKPIDRQGKGIQRRLMNVVTKIETVALSTSLKRILLAVCRAIGDELVAMSNQQSDVAAAPQFQEAPEMVRHFVLQNLEPVAPRVETALENLAKSPRASLASGSQDAPRSVSKRIISKPSLSCGWEEVVLKPLLDKLNACNALTAPPRADEDLVQLLTAGVGRWDLDLFRVAEITERSPLVHVGMMALQETVCDLELHLPKVRSFMASIEALYSKTTPYHNATHAADVMNSMVYFLKLTSTPLAMLDPVDTMGALVAAAAHDAGHDGRNNRFQVVASTSIAQLFNDQHCLEHMHCALTFAVLNTTSCNFAAELTEGDYRVFRNTVVTMILETDLASHQETLKRFKLSFLDEAKDEKSLDGVKKKQLLSFVLKCCDVGGSSKPFSLHARWACRVNAEFFEQGDAELELGLVCSPFCERFATNVADSQTGFFSFIVTPIFSTLNEYFRSRRVKAEVIARMEENAHFWRMFNDKEFDHKDPEQTIPLLQKRFAELALEEGKPKPSARASPKCG